MINSLYIFIKYLKTFSVDLWWFFIDFAKFSALREEEGMVGNNNKIWKIFMKLLWSQWCLGTGSKILFLKCFIFFHKFAHLCLFLYFPVPKLRHSSGWLMSSLCFLPVQASYRQVTLFFTHTMPSPPQCISASRKIS